jgi:hypothetical protein
VAVNAIFRSTTSNPAFQYGQLDSALVGRRNDWGGSSSTDMTVGGTVNKASLLVALSVASAAATWMQVGPYADYVMAYVMAWQQLAWCLVRKAHMPE